MDYYLKADNEMALIDALVRAGILIEIMTTDGELYARQPAPGQNIDIIGAISVPTGRVTVVGEGIVEEREPLPGYHANLRGVLTAEQIAMLPIIPKPNQPTRVWA